MTNPISFFMPAYNCESTIRQSVESIMNHNFKPSDELIIVNDGSTDGTWQVIQQLKTDYPEIILLQHPQNLGGGPTRNTAIKNTRHQLLFCLDSDNILLPASIPALIEFLFKTNADAATFQAVRYFRTAPEEITHQWVYPAGQITLAQNLASHKTPGSSGNYLFTKSSWEKAGGYPNVFLDTWGFGFRQLATGAKMMVLPDSGYLHRYGYDSYWVREIQKNNASLTVLKIITPFQNLILKEDWEYINSPEHRETWFDRLEERPIRVN